jgi:hypothetical protein
MEVVINSLIVIMTLICEIPPYLPFSKGGITSLWPPAHRASGPEGKEGLALLDSASLVHQDEMLTYLI